MSKEGATCEGREPYAKGRCCGVAPAATLTGVKERGNIEDVGRRGKEGSEAA